MIENPFKFWAPPYQIRCMFAADTQKEVTDPHDPSACKWCAWGWLIRMGVPNKTMQHFDQWLNQETGWGIIKSNDELLKPPAWFRKMWDLFMAAVTGKKRAPRVSKHAVG